MPSLQNTTPISCAICGTEFTPKHARQKYCCKQCLWKSKNDRTRAVHGEEINARRREKYASDPEFRAKMLGRNQARYAGDIEVRRERNRQNFQKTRVAQPWLSLLYGAKSRAKKKGIPFALTEAWAESRWTGFCELTGLPFAIGRRGAGPHVFSPSIDKIDPAKGYTPDNCRFLIHAVNAAKGMGTDAELYAIAEAILANRP